MAWFLVKQRDSFTFTLLYELSYYFILALSALILHENVLMFVVFAHVKQMTKEWMDDSHSIFSTNYQGSKISDDEKGGACSSYG
jgi:hypothetical protein